MTNLNTNFSDPSLMDLLNIHKRDIYLDLNCHAIATIQSFDSSKQTVNATVNYKKTYINYDAKKKAQVTTLVEYPVLMDCPVIILGGGNSHITFPINKGDTCLILFNDRDIDRWFQTGQITSPNTNRLHNFSDGIALIGLNSLAKSISDYDSTRALLKNGNAGIGVGTSKVKIFNSSDTLNSLLQDLVNSVKDLVTATAAITVTCSAPGVASSTPINVAQINAVTTSLSTTATKLAGLLE